MCDSVHIEYTVEYKYVFSKSRQLNIKVIKSKWQFYFAWGPIWQVVTACNKLQIKNI